jgi:hypothetical protein
MVDQPVLHPMPIKKRNKLRVSIFHRCLHPLTLLGKKRTMC